LISEKLFDIFSRNINPLLGFSIFSLLPWPRFCFSHIMYNFSFTVVLGSVFLSRCNSSICSLKTLQNVENVVPQIMAICFDTVDS
jgi:hypothetical protein